MRLRLGSGDYGIISVHPVARRCQRSAHIENNGVLMLSGRKPRILFVSHYAELYGAERSLLTLVEALSEAGEAKVIVLMPSSGPLQRELESGGIDTKVIPYKFWIGYRRGMSSLPGRLARTAINLLRALQAWRWAKAWGPDLVYSNSLATPMGLFLAMLLARPHIWHARELVREQMGANYDFGERLAMSLLGHGTEKIICNSATVREKMARYLPEPKLAVIYNGFDFSGTHAPAPADKYDKTVATVPAVRVAIIGSVQPSKGQEDGIRALATLLAEGLEVTLDIIGDGPDDYLDNLKKLASELCVTDHVRFRGYLPDVGAELKEIAVTLVPSRFEAFGRIAVESLAHGTPVVAASAGGLPEIILEGETGMLYQPGNHLELAAKLSALLRDRELYAMISKNGRHDVTQRFTRAKYVSGIQAEISELLTGQKPV